MTEDFRIDAASVDDARDIANLSRKLIEGDLGWSWNRRRVEKAIAHPRTNVFVARIREEFAGFGIMRYYKERANLNLLAVREKFQGRGVGRELVKQLEDVAYGVGIVNLYVQVRETNRGAQEFYTKLGYEMIDLTRGYYRNVESAVIMYNYLENTRRTS